MMKNLLILAYDFPPYVSVGGLRPYAWYRYLKEYGVEPIVVTRQWGNKYGNELDYIAPSESDETIVETTEYGTIIRTPYKPNLANRIMLKYGRTKFSLIRKLVTAWYEFMQFLFFVGPKSGLYRGAKEYLKQNKVDAIIATGEPFVLFKYASALSSKYNIPWVADYRDPWSQSVKRSSNFFSRKMNAYYERKTTSTALCLTTVSDFFKRKIQVSAASSSRVEIITNGYNPDSIDASKSIKQRNDKLRFAYVGTIYKWHPIHGLLDGFKNFVLSNPNSNIELNFYGINNSAELIETIKDKYIELEPFINITPMMPNNELMINLRQCNAMLLFNYYSSIGTKIYDYLAIQRLVLLCFTEDEASYQMKEKMTSHHDVEGMSNHVQEDLLKETNAGISVKNSEHLENVIANLYAEFKAKGYIECNSHGYEQYSRSYQTGKLAKIIFGSNEEKR